MNTVTVTIGLTHVQQADGSISLFGYKPGMSQAAFTVDLPVDGIKFGDGFFNEVAERVFASTNTYGDAYPEVWAVIEPALPQFAEIPEVAFVRGHRDHTAMSVGDTLTFEGKILACDHVGWKEVAS